MSHDLIEVPEFVEPITVPDNIDSAVQRATDLTLCVQNLANRSQFSKLVTDVAARQDAPNAFTDVNEFADVTTFTAAVVSELVAALTPVLDVTQNAADGSGVWKLILRMNLGHASGMNASLYTRADISNERLILVTNADWNGSVWVQRSNVRPSTAILFTTTGTQALSVCQMPAGSANWTTWGLGTLLASDYVYNKTRSIPIPLGGSSNEYDDIGGATYGTLRPISTSDTKQIPLRFPTNMGGGTLQIMHTKADTVASIFEVVGYSANWSSPGALTATNMGGIQTVTTSGVQVTSISIGPFVVGTEYRLRWDAANLNDRLHAVRAFDAFDAGPLNML